LSPADRRQARISGKLAARGDRHPQELPAAVARRVPERCRARSASRDFQPASGAETSSARARPAPKFVRYLGCEILNFKFEIFPNLASKNGRNLKSRR